MRYISLDCPHCGQSLEAPPEMAGQEVECPGCNAFMLKVPVPDSAGTETRKPATDRPPPAHTRSTSHVIRHGKRKGKTSFGPLLCIYGLVVLLCGLFLGAIGYWYLTEDVDQAELPDERPGAMAEVEAEEQIFPEDNAEAATVADDWAAAPENGELTEETAAEVEVESGEWPVKGEDWISSATGMQFAWIESLDMWVGKYEVVNEEYRLKVPDHDSGRERRHSLSAPRQPVVRVNFSDARRFAEWMTAQERRNNHLPENYRYRLPTGTEWTRFARCGDQRQYPWGNDWPPATDQGLNYADEIPGYESEHPYTAPVDGLWRNEWGLYAVGGNVWELTTNRHEEFEAWRGGSWNDFEQEMLRCDYQYRPFPFGADTRLGNLGFRLVLSPR